jgi:histidine ammonia-lyase
LRERPVLGTGISAVYEAIRAIVPFLVEDAVMAPALEAIYQLLSPVACSKP